MLSVISRRTSGLVNRAEMSWMGPSVGGVLQRFLPGTPTSVAKGGVLPTAKSGEAPLSSSDIHTFARPLTNFRNGPNLDLDLSPFSDDNCSINTWFFNLSQAKKAIPANFIEVLYYWAAKNPSLVLYEYTDSLTGLAKEVTYYEAVAEISQIRQFLDNKGIKQGDSMILMLGNNPASIPWFFAMLSKGIVAVPCPDSITSSELDSRIQELGASAVITTPDCESTVDSVRANSPSLKLTVTSGFASPNWDTLSAVREFVPSIEKLQTNTLSNDDCMVLYTSGTSAGKPKPVVQSHAHPFGFFPLGERVLGLNSSSVVLYPGTTGWGLWLWTLCATSAMGARMTVPAESKGGFNARQILATIQTRSVTHICTAPSLLRSVVELDAFNVANLSALKRVVVVGEPPDDTTLAKVRQRGVRVGNCYGKAESLPILGNQGLDDYVPGKMGMPIPPYSGVVIADDDLQPVAVGTTGEICVINPDGQMGTPTRYHGMQSLTEELLRDPLLTPTGDLAVENSDSSYSFKGRLGDQLKVGGETTSATEVEEPLKQHPQIDAAVVTGICIQPDSPIITVTAFIKIKENSQLSKEREEKIVDSIVDFLNKKGVPSFRQPKSFMFPPSHKFDEFKTASGKTQRVKFKEWAENTLYDSLVETRGNDTITVQDIKECMKKHAAVEAAKVKTTRLNGHPPDLTITANLAKGQVPSAELEKLLSKHLREKMRLPRNRIVIKLVSNTFATSSDNLEHKTDDHDDARGYGLKA